MKIWIAKFRTVHSIDFYFAGKPTEEQLIQAVHNRGFIGYRECRGILKDANKKQFGEFGYGWIVEEIKLENEEAIING